MFVCFVVLGFFVILGGCFMNWFVFVGLFVFEYYVDDVLWKGGCGVLCVWRIYFGFVVFGVFVGGVFVGDVLGVGVCGVGVFGVGVFGVLVFGVGVFGVLVFGVMGVVGVLIVRMVWMLELLYCMSLRYWVLVVSLV